MRRRVIAFRDTASKSNSYIALNSPDMLGLGAAEINRLYSPRKPKSGRYLAKNGVHITETSRILTHVWARSDVLCSPYRGAHLALTVGPACV